MSKKNDPKKPDLNEELEGFDIHINEFGEIVSTFEVERLNTFLNKNVDDKKLQTEDDPSIANSELTSEEE